MPSRASSSTSSIRRSKRRWRCDLSRIAFVVAYDRNKVIGKGGTLPWRLPDDMKHVRALTVGKPVIMGRRTYESFPRRPLPDRTNIVLTRDPSFKAEGAKIARTPEEAVALAGDAPETIVFGGAEVFKQFMPMVDRVYLTEVDADVKDGDTFFPPFGKGINFTVLENVPHPADGRHPYAFRFLTLERIRP
jgi:dihydrofolate reductase